MTVPRTCYEQRTIKIREIAMKNIFTVVKMCSSEEYANDFCQGRLYANPLGYFQRLEEKGNRADRDEGAFWEPLDSATFTLTATGPNGNDSIILAKKDLERPISFQFDRTKCLNVFCLYAFHSGQLPDRAEVPRHLDVYRQECRIPESCQEDFGEHAVVVTNFQEFKARVAKALRHQYLSENICRYKMDLVNYQNYQPLFSPVPTVSDLHAAFYKGERFRDQSEYRVVFDTGRDKEKPCTLNIGNISDIISRIKTSEIQGHFEAPIRRNNDTVA